MLTNVGVMWGQTTHTCQLLLFFLYVTTCEISVDVLLRSAQPFYGSAPFLVLFKTKHDKNKRTYTNLGFCNGSTKYILSELNCKSPVTSLSRVSVPI